MCHRILFYDSYLMLQNIVVTLDRWSVYSLSRCVHTLDQVELDSQHAPSSSSRVGFKQYTMSASTCIPESLLTRVDSHYPKFAQLVLCGVVELRSPHFGLHYAELWSFFSTPPQAWQVRDRQPEVYHELPKLFGS